MFWGFIKLHVLSNSQPIDMGFFKAAVTKKYKKQLGCYLSQIIKQDAGKWDKKSASM